jgi:tetratricopeptide (TPR) repeat protein
MNAKNTKVLLPAALFLLAAAWLCQAQAVRWQKRAFPVPFAFSLPLPPDLSRSSLVGALSGLRAPAADWMYIDLLQYFGNRVNRLDGRYRRVHGLAQEMLWLDPTFHFGVLDGAAILAWNVERPAEAIDLLQRAIAADPAYPRYQLYLGAITYTQGKAFPEAVRLMEALVREPGRPEILLRTLGNLYLKLHDWDKAQAYWRWVLTISDDPDTLKMAEASVEKAQRHEGTVR